jgi:hypothetical protein
MVDLKDIETLEKHFDERYVMQSDCADIQMANNKKFANDDKRISANTDTLNGFKKLGWIIITALIAEVVVGILGLLQSA